MNTARLISRRQAVRQSLLLPLVTGASGIAAEGGARAAAGNSAVLVAYFSRTGNTRLIASQIGRALDATLFEIMPATAYPEDYEAQVAQAEDERQRGFEPPLRAEVAGMRSFATVFLGFPIWGTTAPAIIRSFLSRHDLSGMALVPFVTHGGYGVGSSVEVVARHAPAALLAKPFVKRCDQERETLNEVTRWLGAVRVAR